MDKLVLQVGVLWILRKIYHATGYVVPDWILMIVAAIIWCILG